MLGSIKALRSYRWKGLNCLLNATHIYKLYQFKEKGDLET